MVGRGRAGGERLGREGEMRQQRGGDETEGWCVFVLPCWVFLWDLQA